jgi:hypothetical protein
MEFLFEPLEIGNDFNDLDMEMQAVTCETGYVCTKGIDKVPESEGEDLQV